MGEVLFKNLPCCGCSFRGNASDNDDKYVREIEVLNFDGKQADYTDDGVGSAIALDVSSVLDMTDDRNTLFVQGDAKDTISMLGDWTQEAALHDGDDGRTYQLFTTTYGGETVNVYVDTDIVIVP